MIVTDIVEFDKRRNKVYIDGEFAFVLYRGEFSDYHIKKDTVLPEDVYRMIMAEVLPKRAKLRAMKLLTARAYTQERLRRKLEEGLYPESVIEEALEYVKSFGYIDDEAYALEYITCHASEMNRRQMEIKLMQKGIAKDDISGAFENYYAEYGAIDETGQIQDILFRKHLRPEELSVQEINKIKAALYRKGFTSDSISKAIDAFT